ncbi:hypothetical protein JCGZ_24376 [Jatropha curcas]|uniref:Uncharacterized protein n=1 Tax=Jatropha curcas TaxID=180498 RepID=A0A067L2E2_JATCU|nr:hypothetical protein JCGZ_24376 [Jatropha curcas]
MFYNMYYLGGRVYEWELDLDQRRVPHDIPYYMLSTRSLQLEQDIASARRGLAATYHLVAFVSGAYAIFAWTQLLIHVPPPTEFDPFAETEELDKGPVARSACPGHVKDTSCQSMPDVTPGCTHVSIDDYNEVCSLYEATCLKLAERVDMAPSAGRGRGMRHGWSVSRGAGHSP